MRELKKKKKERKCGDERKGVDFDPLYCFTVRYYTISKRFKCRMFKTYSMDLAGRTLTVETGKMAAQVLLGEKAVSDIEVKTLTPTVVYNNELCQELGIEVPAE